MTSAEVGRCHGDGGRRDGGAVLGAALLLLPPLPGPAGAAGPAPGTGGRAAGTGPRLTPFCSPLGQAERQVELQRVRAAPGLAQGEGRGLRPRRAPPPRSPRCPPRCLSPQVYGRGSGRDCRHHVQKLNSLQGEAEEAIARTARYGTGGGGRGTAHTAGSRTVSTAGGWAGCRPCLPLPVMSGSFISWPGVLLLTRDFF